MARELAAASAAAAAASQTLLQTSASSQASDTRARQSSWNSTPDAGACASP
jgi:hypothetical protein